MPQSDEASRADPRVRRYRPAVDAAAATPVAALPVREIGGRTDGPEPTRYGDWEKNGRCIDF